MSNPNLTPFPRLNLNHSKGWSDQPFIIEILDPSPSLEQLHINGEFQLSGTDGNSHFIHAPKTEGVITLDSTWKDTDITVGYQVFDRTLPQRFEIFSLETSQNDAELPHTKDAVSLLPNDEADANKINQKLLRLQRNNEFIQSLAANNLIIYQNWNYDKWAGWFEGELSWKYPAYASKVFSYDSTKIFASSDSSSTPVMVVPFQSTSNQNSYFAFVATESSIQVYRNINAKTPTKIFELSVGLSIRKIEYDPINRFLYILKDETSIQKIYFDFGKNLLIPIFTKQYSLDSPVFDFIIDAQSRRIFVSRTDKIEVCDMNLNILFDILNVNSFKLLKDSQSLLSINSDGTLVSFDLAANEQQFKNSIYEDFKTLLGSQILADVSVINNISLSPSKNYILVSTKYGLVLMSKQGKIIYVVEESLLLPKNCISATSDDRLGIFCCVENVIVKFSENFNRVSLLDEENFNRNYKYPREFLELNRSEFFQSWTINKKVRFINEYINTLVKCIDKKLIFEYRNNGDLLRLISRNLTTAEINELKELFDSEFEILNSEPATVEVFNRVANGILGLQKKVLNFIKPIQATITQQANIRSYPFNELIIID